MSILPKERLFVAAALPGPVKDRLARLASESFPASSFQKWVEPADCHITVHFLGDTDRPTRDRVIEALGGLRFPPLTLNVSGAGTFGNPSAPSILWAGVQGDTAALAALQQATVRLLEPLGFAPEERPYRPHITLARRYAGESRWRPEQLEPFIAALRDSPELVWTLDSLTLYRTHMGRKPMYEAIYSG